MAERLTFLLTDIEGSTRLWDEHSAAMAEAITHHDRLIRETVSRAGGEIFKATGDGFMTVFTSADAALKAALEVQLAVQKRNPAPIGGLKVRMALHRGDAERREGDYFGPAVNEAARLLDLAYGGEVLVSDDVRRAAGELALNMRLVDLGTFRMSGVSRMPRVFRLDHAGLSSRFPDPGLEEATTRPPGTSVRGYVIQRFLGRGANGSVYVARQQAVGRDVALKVFDPQYANHPEVVRRFESEAQLVARLEHPHIVPLYDYWRDPQGAYVAMRWVRAGNLRQALKDAPLSSEQAWAVLEQIGPALATAHRQGVIHRNLKSENVLLDEDSNAFLSDFAMAGKVEVDDRYQAPEEIEGGSATVQTDVYHFGLLLRDLLGVPGEANLDAAEVVARALSPRPEDRHHTIAELLSDLRQRLTGKPSSAAVDTIGDLENPYRGLRPFEEADACNFFGREALVDQLIQQLHDEDRRVLLVVGPSGSGKSSVVHAGLVPALRDGRLAGSEEWLITSMVPGEDPFEELEQALLRVAIDQPQDLGSHLRRSSEGLSDLIPELLPSPGVGLVLIVDQFEELFTQVMDETTRGAFLASLTQAATRTGGLLRVVITLRADFYDRPLGYREFGALVRDRSVTVIPMEAQELERAIRRPAERAGLIVEPALTAQMIADVAEEPGALPLLQYALTALFEQRRGSRLTLRDYQRIGGVQGALAQRAEEVYEEMGQDLHGAVREVFLRLVTLGEGARDTRRRVPLGELESIPGGSEVLEVFGRHRLLSFDRDPQTRAPVVEVSHEAVLSVWPRLREWIDEGRGDLRTLRMVEREAASWVASDRDLAYLLRGSRLEQAVEWRESTTLRPTDLVAEFVATSVAERDQQQALEKERMERELHLERRASRRQRAFIMVLAVGVLVALGLSLWAFRAERLAEEQARIATVRELAAASAASLEIDPELSLLLALEAANAGQGAIRPEAEEALHRAVLAGRLVGRISHNGEGIAHYSPDGRSFVTSGEDPTTVVVWRVDPLEPQVVLDGHGELVVDAVYDPAGARIATTSFDGTVRVWDATTGDSPLVLEVEGGPPLIPVFSRDGSRLAASSISGTVWVWDLRTEEVIWELIPPEGTIETLNLDFSPDGSLLVVAPVTDQDVPEFGAHVWDLDSGDLVAILSGHQWDVKDVGFTPDGTLLLTGSWDTTVKLWDVKTWENVRTFFGHENSVWDLQISADGTKVASSGNVQALVWDLSTLETLSSLAGHTGIVDGIDLSPDGNLLLTSSFTDSTTRLWDLTPHASHELLGLPGPEGGFGGVAFSPDGGTLAASRGEGLVTLWEFPGGGEITTVEGPGSAVDSIEFSPDGEFLALAGTGGISLLDVDGGQVTSLVEGVESSEVAFSSSGLLATGGEGGRLWTVPPGPEGEFLSDLWTYAVTFDPEATIVVMSLDDGDEGIVEIRDLDSGELLRTLDQHDAPVLEIEFSPDGSWLVTGSLDTTAIIWDATTFEPVRRLEGHVGQVLAVDFHPTRQEVATSGDDGTIKMWSVEAGAVRLNLPSGATSDLAYSPDGRYLAAIGPEGAVSVYIIDVEELVQAAHDRLTRWWTEAECLQYLHMSECPAPPAARES